MPVVFADKKPDGVAIVTLAKEPVNTMGFDLWQDLQAVFSDCEADTAVRAVVFQSGLKKPVFTAGLDINELYAPNTSKERFFDFWSLLTKVLVQIYRSPLLTVAAINGACPAGGCALSLCCDFRIITSDGTMGLNEVPLGLMPPPFWARLFTSYAGQRQGEKLLEMGTLASASELLKLDMVDAVVAKADELIPTAMDTVVKPCLKSLDLGRAETKKVLRKSFADEWARDALVEAEHLWWIQSNPVSMETLGKVLARLSGGKKKAGGNAKSKL